MKKTYLLLVLSVFLLSCNKEDESLIAKYQTVYGFWKTQTVSYDSSGVTVISTPYNRLSININDDLTYKIFQDSVNNIENGSIKILTQTNDILEMNFTPNFPNYSSIAGSHIFSTANVILISLTDNEWSTTEQPFDYTQAYHLGLYYGYKGSSLQYSKKYVGLSVRCLKDN